MFDALPEVAKHEVALEILRCTRELEFPPLTDDLAANAKAVFLDLDRREIPRGMNDEHSDPRKMKIALLPCSSRLRPALETHAFEVGLTLGFLKQGLFDAQNLITVPHAKLVRRLGNVTAQ